MKFKSLFRRGHGSSSARNGPCAVAKSRPRDPGQGGPGGGGEGAAAPSGGCGGHLGPTVPVSASLQPASQCKQWAPLPECPPSSSSDASTSATASMELDALRTELTNMIREKSDLEDKVQELIRCHGELNALREEVSKLKEQRHEAEQGLLARLNDVNLSPLSDSEKEELLLCTPNNRHANSAPASIAPANGESTEMLDPGDWDKHSSSSVSEVSVACLQDRIIQMEETHYSTNEELQATLQELADLQVQLTELQSDNERLGEEKGVLLESLCRQTERLEDARSKVDTLQGLLLDNAPPTSDREQKLVQLLKSAQEEKEMLLVKQGELSNEVKELRRNAELVEKESGRLEERVRLLESTVDATHAERKQLDQELALAKEESSSRHIEISRLTTLLDNARAKIEELEAVRDKLGDKSELDELLDNARKEKDILESQTASLQEQLSRSQCEVNRLKEQLNHLQEEWKVSRNNAKSALSNLQFEFDKEKSENEKLTHELQVLQENLSELQMQCQCHLDDKRQLKAMLSETQKQVSEFEDKLNQTERALNEEKKLRQFEISEWEQFQADLLMTVRVANDMKTEAQVELERLVNENKQLRDKNHQLDIQVDKLKAVEKPTTLPLRSDSTTSVLTTVMNHEISRRSKISRQDSRLSVKSLIESIENATKQAKTGPGGSRSSSTSSLSSLTSGGGQPTTPTSPLLEAPMSKTPLRDHTQLNNKQSSGRKSVITNALSGERKDPLSVLVKNGGSKRNALLKWCQNKTAGYGNIDITNFSSSWNDGLALCAILHSYLPDRVPYHTLTPNEKRRNFSIAFAAAESVGIPTTLNIVDMIQQERPDWNQVMAYVTSIFKHFET
ncbi:cytospin-A isoform X2 [Bemisia tabaci]|uniref:cytospin-A isoform X2 n=1 Tax=Bemisia tabaci TaxID=7038 RepID=UPI0008F9B2B1|nr:PREDICTED: cytospin-A-like isoform X2 [Bemisia tabaci]